MIMKNPSYSYVQGNDELWHILHDGIPLKYVTPLTLEENARLMVKLGNKWIYSRKMSYSEELSIFVEMLHIMKERGMVV